MPRYVVHAYDYTDADALDRRMAVRANHFAGARVLRDGGHFVLGGALLDPDGKMIGSMMLLDFDNEAQIDQWLAVEPYVRNRVWEKIDIKPFRQAEL